jgi:flagellar hook-length control protein FliK
VADTGAAQGESARGARASDDAGTGFAGFLRRLQGAETPDSAGSPGGQALPADGKDLPPVPLAGDLVDAAIDLTPLPDATGDALSAELAVPVPEPSELAVQADFDVAATAPTDSDMSDSVAMLTGMLPATDSESNELSLVADNTDALLPTAAASDEPDPALNPNLMLPAGQADAGSRRPWTATGFFVAQAATSDSQGRSPASNPDFSSPMQVTVEVRAAEPAAPSATAAYRWMAEAGAPPPVALPAAARGGDGKVAGEGLTEIQPGRIASSSLNLPTPFGGLQPQPGSGPVVPPTGAPVLTMTTPPQDPGFGQALGEHLVFISSKNLGSAEIRMVPAELGPVTVQLVVDDGKADVSFTAHHPLTREAIESAMPKLREMLGANGLSLGHSSVSDQGVPQGHRDGNSENGPRSGFSAGNSLTPVDEPSARTVERVLQGLLDTFA